MASKRDSKAKHDWYLDKLVGNLKSIGEQKKDIQWVMKDGIWLMEDDSKQYSLCDLIVTYYDHTATPVELKGSRDKIQKAKKQLYQGREFIEDVLEYKSNPGKFVVYDKGDYIWEPVYFTKRRTSR